MLEKILEKGKANPSLAYALGGGLVLCILLLLLFLGGRGGQSSFALHFSDSWRDIGRIDDQFYFREEDTLYCYNRQGKRWESALDPNAQIAYAKEIHIFQPGGSWIILDPSSGKKVAEKSMGKLTAIASVPAGTYSKSELLGLEPGRFRLYDDHFQVQKVQQVAGNTGSYRSQDQRAIWTAWGTAQDMEKTGQVQLNADVAALIDRPKDPGRALLVQAEEGKEVFRLLGDAPFRNLRWTGEDSFISSSGGALYFVHGKELVGKVPFPEGSDVGVNADGVWVLSKRSLRRYDQDGKEEETLALDFDAKMLAVGEKEVYALASNRRYHWTEKRQETEETAEWIGLVTDIEGRSSLVYREELLLVQ